VLSDDWRASNLNTDLETYERSGNAEFLLKTIENFRSDFIPYHSIGEWVK
jgi:hypothetical protein